MTGQIFEQRSQKRDNRKNVVYHTKFMGQDKAYSTTPTTTTRTEQ